MSLPGPQGGFGGGTGTTGADPGETLAAILGVGNASGLNDIAMAAGQLITFGGDVTLSRPAAGVLTVGDALRVGTATDATATGDFGAGTTSRNIFFDKAAGTLTVTNKQAVDSIGINYRAVMTRADQGSAAGFGGSYTFLLETSTNSTVEESGSIASVWRDPTSGAAFADMQISVRRNSINTVGLTVGNSTTPTGPLRVEVLTHLIVGTAAGAAAAALGDASFTDGTREFSWEASTNTVTLGVEAATTTIQGLGALTILSTAPNALQVLGGDGTGAGAGSSVSVIGGAGGPTDGIGGDLILKGGDSGGGFGAQGDVIIDGGGGGGVVSTISIGATAGSVRLSRAGQITIVVGILFVTETSQFLGVADFDAGITIRSLEAITGDAELTLVAGVGANAITVTGGAGLATGPGGPANITSGVGGSTSGNSGDVNISSGTTTNGISGNITISTGNALGGTNDSGDLSFDTGTSGGGTVGTITLGGTNASALILGRTGLVVSIPESVTFSIGAGPTDHILGPTDQNLVLRPGNTASRELILRDRLGSNIVRVFENTAQFDGSGGLILSATSGGFRPVDDVRVAFGTGADAIFEWDTGQIANALLLALKTSRNFILIDNANLAKDHDRAAQTNPTFTVFSAKDPDTDNTEWVSLSHDQTDARLSVGSGQLVIDAAVQIDGDLNHDGTNVGFYGTAPAAQSAAYTRNATIVEDRTLLQSSAATILNNNNVLAAIVADLQATGLFG